MIICVKCKKTMGCIKTGVSADFGFGHCYAGDKYECPKCGTVVLDTLRSPHYDPEYTFHDEYLRMPEPENH